MNLFLLPLRRKMKFFKKRDKSASGLSKSPDAVFGAAADQRYLTVASPTSGQFQQQPPSLALPSPPRGRHHRGLKGLAGFGSSDNHHNAPTGSLTAADDQWGVYMPTGTYVPPTAASARALQKLPEAVLERIFATVCPHSQDRTYERCEESSMDDTCMLCDMRDLAHCVQVCRRWRGVAERTLYTSVRIDSVHYCQREAILAEKRKRRSFFERNAEPEDTADARLKLLCRTLREDPTRRLGPLVQFLKIPYMLRESKHADIARTVSVLPNLRYVDLPEGLFMDDPVFLTLKLEIQAKCPDLRKMTYMAGAERSLEALANGTLWRNLEVLELVKIGMDPTMMRHVLGGLTQLRALKVTESAAGPHAFSDDVLVSSAYSEDPSALQQSAFLPDIPPLEELVLTDTQRITADGLRDYLSRPDVRNTLRVLTLHGTNVKPWTLQTLLSMAPSLRHLTLVDEVTTSLPIAAGTKDIRPLVSHSLRTLNYEIKAAHGVSPYAGVTRSYYNYLSGSILSGGLPNLQAVYVCDAQFPDSLLGLGLLPPSMPAAGGGGGLRRPGSSSSLSSGYGSPFSAGSLGPVQSPNGFLSPHNSPGFAPPPQQRNSYAPPQQRPMSQNPNPFTDAQSPFKSTTTSLSTSSGGGGGSSLAPPPKPWAAGHNPRFSSNNPFAGMISPQKVQTLEVFTKGDDDLDWSSIVVGGNDGLDMGGGEGTSSRPVSSYGLGADLGGSSMGARKSVLINTGAGGFLAVPDATPAERESRPNGGGNYGHGRHGSNVSTSSDLWPRPRSSAGEKKSEKLDLWR